MCVRQVLSTEFIVIDNFGIAILNSGSYGASGNLLRTTDSSWIFSSSPLSPHRVVSGLRLGVRS